MAGLTCTGSWGREAVCSPRNHRVLAVEEAGPEFPGATRARVSHVRSRVTAPSPLVPWNLLCWSTHVCLGVFQAVGLFIFSSFMDRLNYHRGSSGLSCFSKYGYRSLHRP